jgi:GNAT superfamily N-acetyltransferase
MTLDLSAPPQTAIVSLESPTELQSMGKLLDRVFPVLPGGTYFDDFPVWNSAPSDQLIRMGVLGSEGGLQSCAAGRVSYLRTSMGGLLPIGLIGAVATDPDQRKRGLASQVVDAVTQQLAEKGVGAVFLWGSEHTLYQRLGFELCGEQSRIPLSRFNLPDSKQNHGYSLGPSVWSPALFEVQKRRRHGLALSAHDATWMSAHKNTTWWTATKNGKIVACLAYLRGMDMQGIVHEWTGAPDALRLLLDAFRATHPHAELLCNDLLLREAGFQEKVENLEYLCLGKILRPELFLGAYGRAHQARCVQRIEEGTLEVVWDVTLQFHPTHTFSSRELSKLFFGPEQFSEFSSNAALKGVQDSWDPIPLWFWGLDAA